MGASKVGRGGWRRKRRNDARRLGGRTPADAPWRQDGGACERLLASLRPSNPEVCARDRESCMRVDSWAASAALAPEEVVGSSELLQKLQENFQSQAAGGKPWRESRKGKRFKRRFPGAKRGKVQKKTEAVRMERPECWGVSSGDPLAECWVGQGSAAGKGSCGFVDRLRFEGNLRHLPGGISPRVGEGDGRFGLGPRCARLGGGCVGVLDGVECGTERQNGCLGSWLDSLPDMMPGTLLCSDDECDTAPCPSPDLHQGNVTSEFHAAIVSANSTPLQNVAPQLTLQRKPIVFLWDLDETIILSTSLTSGQFAQYNRDLDERKLADLGGDWSKASTYISEKHLYSKQIRNEDRATVSDLHHYDDGRLLSNYDFSCDLAANGFSGEDGLRKLAYRYRKITEFYKLGLERSSVSKYVPFWQDLWNKTDSCCKNWLSSVQNLLEATLASDQDVIHVIVTAGCLVPSLTKLMLFQMDQYFDIHNVFSSHPLPDGKFDVFRAVRERFGPGAAYCAIGDGPYEELAAAENGWPFVRISLAADGLPTVGTSGGGDALGRIASTPMNLSRDDLFAAAHTVVPTRARVDVPLKFKESTRRQTTR